MTNGSKKLFLSQKKNGLKTSFLFFIYFFIFMNSVSLKLDFFCPIEFLLTNAIFELFPKSPYILNEDYNQNLIGQFFDILGKVHLERKIFAGFSYRNSLQK